MQIIIVGCGKVGRTLAEQLQEEESDITLIDVSSNVITSLQDDIDAMGIVGNGASINTLVEAGIENADILIAVTGSDEMNLLCCLIAQKTGHCQTIARVRNPIYAKEISFIKKRLGVTMIINPELAAAQEISRLLRFPSAIKIDTFARGRVEMLKFKVLPEFNLDGMTISRITEALKCDVLFCAVESRDHVSIPGGNQVIHDGDLERMCGVPGRVAEKTAEELAALRLAGSEEHIPLLEEVLPLFAGRAPLVVELKTDRHGAAALARDTVDCLDRFSIDYCVESFDPRPLRWLRRHRPSVLRGQLSQDFHRHPSGQGPWNRLALTNLFYNAFTRPDFVAYRFGDREKPAVRLCRKFGMRMAYWTLRSRADVALAEQEGALPIFEEPDRPKEVTH